MRQNKLLLLRVTSLLLIACHLTPGTLAKVEIQPRLRGSFRARLSTTTAPPASPIPDEGSDNEVINEPAQPNNPPPTVFTADKLRDAPFPPARSPEEGIDQINPLPFGPAVREIEGEDIKELGEVPPEEVDKIFKEVTSALGTYDEQKRRSGPNSEELGLGGVDRIGLGGGGDGGGRRGEGRLRNDYGGEEPNFSFEEFFKPKKEKKKNSFFSGEIPDISYGGLGASSNQKTRNRDYEREDPYAALEPNPYEPAAPRRASGSRNRGAGYTSEDFEPEDYLGYQGESQGPDLSRGSQSSDFPQYSYDDDFYGTREPERSSQRGNSYSPRIQDGYDDAYADIEAGPSFRPRSRDPYDDRNYYEGQNRDNSPAPPPNPRNQYQYSARQQPQEEEVEEEPKKAESSKEPTGKGGKKCKKIQKTVEVEEDFAGFSNDGDPNYDPANYQSRYKRQSKKASKAKRPMTCYVCQDEDGRHAERCSYDSTGNGKPGADGSYFHSSSTSYSDDGNGNKKETTNGKKRPSRKSKSSDRYKRLTSSSNAKLSKVPSPTSTTTKPTTSTEPAPKKAIFASDLKEINSSIPIKADLTPRRLQKRQSINNRGPPGRFGASGPSPVYPGPIGNLRSRGPSGPPRYPPLPSTRGVGIGPAPNAYVERGGRFRGGEDEPHTAAQGGFIRQAPRGGIPHIPRREYGDDDREFGPYGPDADFGPPRESDGPGPYGGGGGPYGGGRERQEYDDGPAPPYGNLDRGESRQRDDVPGDREIAHQGGSGGPRAEEYDGNEDIFGGRGSRDNIPYSYDFDDRKYNDGPPGDLIRESGARARDPPVGFREYSFDIPRDFDPDAQVGASENNNRRVGIEGDGGEGRGRDVETFGGGNFDIGYENYIKRHFPDTNQDSPDYRDDGYDEERTQRDPYGATGPSGPANGASGPSRDAYGDGPQRESSNSFGHYGQAPRPEPITYGPAPPASIGHPNLGYQPNRHRQHTQNQHRYAPAPRYNQYGGGGGGGGGGSYPNYDDEEGPYGPNEGGQESYNDDDLYKAVGSFKRKDRRGCQKIDKDGMICYLCADPKGMKKQECMYEDPSKQRMAYHEVAEYSSHPPTSVVAHPLSNPQSNVAESQVVESNAQSPKGTSTRYEHTKESRKIERRVSAPDYDFES